MINAIRVALITVFLVSGIVCIGAVSLLYITSGTQHNVVNRMNKVFFQVKADAEVDRLIQQGVFTPAQEPAIRGFVRRTYVNDCIVLIYGLGTGLLALGVALITAAFCVWTSYRLSKLSSNTHDIPPSL